MRILDDNSNMIKLHEIEVTFRDSCKSYALKRIGYKYDLSLDSPSYEELLYSGDFQVIKKNFDYQVGDLLIWETEVDYLVPHKITADGRILSVWRTDFGHMAVVERDGCVSDLTQRQDDVRRITMRKMENVKTPDTLLRLKKPV